MNERVISRISIFINPDLLRKFDEALKRIGYESRSKAMQTSTHAFVTESKWTCIKMGEGISALVLTYDHKIKDVERVLTEIQHGYRSISVTKMHVHLDENNCLEIIPVEGMA